MKRRIKIIGVAILAAIVCVVAAGYMVLLRRSPGNYFEHEGTRLFYSENVGRTAVASDHTKESVVLLHGFAVNGDLNWRLSGLAKALQKEYRVVVLDQRGHGLSDKPTNPTAYGAEMAHDVIRLMDHLEIARAHVAGYSLGGYVALKVAALHPDRVLSTSVLGAGWQDPADSRGEQAFAAFEKIASDLEAGRPIEPVATMFSEGEHKTTAYHRAQVGLVVKLLGNRPALAAMLRGVRGLALSRGELVSITTPMLMVCGEVDPNYTSAVKLKEAKPECAFVPVPGRSHPATALSTELREALLDFLRTHRGK